MREILFRGKRKDRGEWVEGCYTLYPDGKNEILRKCDTPPDSDPMWRKVLISYEVDPSTVCQYTGLTDKTGRKIFEGDILMCHGNKNDLVKVILGSFYVVDIETLEKVDEVIGWYYEVIPTDSISKTEPFNLSMPLTDMYIKTCEMEVIGNIFDNHELLKGR